MKTDRVPDVDTLLQHKFFAKAGARPASAVKDKAIFSSKCRDLLKQARTQTRRLRRKTLEAIFSDEDKREEEREKERERKERREQRALERQSTRDRKREEIVERTRSSTVSRSSTNTAPSTTTTTTTTALSLGQTLVLASLRTGTVIGVHFNRRRSSFLQDLQGSLLRITGDGEEIGWNEGYQQQDGRNSPH
eukprot:TRINITY_DN5821_c1_g3_i1.p1 TRINITY_DN5821_c1_g3~~TRINITY_DN5821_c1_g3_i1.p1  ORF type:complete len:192 (+),score=43.17 TRINITY_DN5821_c1_g3_i1:358-933(+)